MHKLVLCSKSPRRFDLLQKEGFLFRVCPIEISEILEKNLNWRAQIEELAIRKAQAAADSGLLSGESGILILAGDTVVELDGEILGKPQDLDQAKNFLVRLSGRSHRVVTAVSLFDLDARRVVVGSELTEVTFHKLSQDEISAYIATNEPYDKAGGYGIQGPANKFVAHIEGSLDNVIGLPMQLLLRLLSENGWQIAKENK
jgi:septum formation protein